MLQSESVWIELIILCVCVESNKGEVVYTDHAAPQQGCARGDNDTIGGCSGIRSHVVVDHFVNVTHA
jgi:hypothetical protein